MDAFVQLIRNALCCVKDLNLFGSTFLYDPKVTAQYYIFPEPLDKTTPLEVLIGITQFYAFASISKTGYTLLVTSVGKFYRIQRLLEHRQHQQQQQQQKEEAGNDKTKDEKQKMMKKEKEEEEEETKKKKKKSRNEVAAEQLINESLLHEGKLAIRSLIIGANVLPLGIAFFWLFANSFHITETDFIGGIWGLIHALTVMEIALVPLLYYMIIDGLEQLSKSSQMKQLVIQLQSNNYKTILDDTDIPPLGTFEMMSQWSPFWKDGISIFATSSSSQSNNKTTTANQPTEQEKQQLNNEIGKVGTFLDSYRNNANATTTTTDKDDSLEKEQKIRQRLLKTSCQRLQDEYKLFQLVGYREFLYFLLNFIAFYGYLLGIICFYFADDGDEYQQPSSIRMLKLGYRNMDAEWNGNFAGDLMWTIEPAVILSTPFLFNFVKSAPTTTPTTTTTTTTTPPTKATSENKEKAE